MEDTTIIEQDVPVTEVPVEGTSTTEPTIVEQPTEVVEQVTPMDNNSTYNNLPKEETTYDPTKDAVQNAVQDAIKLESNVNLNLNSGKALNNFLTRDYDYDREEAGSYWVAGGINDKDTQMSFLNTIINEEMYDEMDLQKYYYDKNMATARAYAANKEKETAYGFYRAAQEKAIAEAQLTGWYMPAEGQYMLMQYEAALDNLKDPNADHIKANNIKNTTEQWFAANKITPRGIKCLSMMNYEENVRHNTIMGELQKEANKIAASQAGASAASAKLQLRQLKFQLEEYELQSGHNITKEIGLDNKDFIGHDTNEAQYRQYQALSGFGSKQDMNALANMLTSAPEYYSAVLGARGKNWLDDVLTKNGKDPQEYYGIYQADIGTKGLAESYENNGNILDESYLNQTKWTISANEEGGGKKIEVFHVTENGKPVTKCYWKDSNEVYHQIKDPNLEIVGGKTLKELVPNFSDTQLEYNGEGIHVGKRFNRSEMAGSYSSKNYKNYQNLNEKQAQYLKQAEQSGYYVADGIVSLENENQSWVVTDGNGNYKEVNKDGLKDVKAKDSKLMDINIGNDGKITVKQADGDERTVHQQMHTKSYINLALNKAEKIGELNSTKSTQGYDIYRYANSDGSEAYLMKVRGSGNLSKENMIVMNGESLEKLLNGEDNIPMRTYTKSGDKEITFNASEDGAYAFVSDGKQDTKDFSVINKAKEDRLNYKNAYIETKAGKNSDTIIDEDSEALRQKVLEMINENNSSNISVGGGSSTTKSGYDQEDTVDIHDPQIEKIIIEMKDTPEFKGLTDKEILKKISENQNYYGDFLNQFK